MSRTSPSDDGNTKTQPLPTGEARLLGYPQAAAYSGIDERTLRGLWATRRIAAVKVGSRVFFDRADLDEFIRRNRVPAIRRD